MISLFIEGVREVNGKRDANTLQAGSSQQGKQRLASTGSNCVTAMFFFSPLCSYVLSNKEKNPYQSNSKRSTNNHCSVAKKSTQQKKIKLQTIIPYRFGGGSKHSKLVVHHKSTIINGIISKYNKILSSFLFMELH